jgi:hypothetical protein
MRIIGKFWPWRAALIAAAALALGLRLYGLEAPGLSHDEAFSWRLTEYDFGEMSRRSGADVHPPFYYALLKAWTGVLGDSVAALRGLSVLLGTLTVLIVYVLVLEALQPLAALRVPEPCEREAASGPACSAVHKSGALFASLLLAVGPAQVAASQHARMYGLGVFLGALTAWLLLRACRSGPGYWLWWAAYGTAAGLFCYTHNYAFFTLFGQGLFVIGCLCFSRKPFMAKRGQLLIGFAYATLIAFILYLPWIPVLLEQIRQVKSNYWIEPVSLPLVERVLFTWATGLPFQGESTFWMFVVLFLLAIALVMWRQPRAGAFFLLQTATPLVLSVGLSLGSGRSIFLDHCLVFAQVALFAFMAVLWSALPGWIERAAVACLLLAASIAGLASYLDGLPTGTPALAQAAEFLRERAAPGAEVWTATAWDLNQLRYYLSQAGGPQLIVRCRQNPFPAEGHQVHIASLRAEDFVWDRPDQADYPERLWIVGAAAPPPGQWELVLDRTFFDGRASTQVALYKTKRPR